MAPLLFNIFSCFFDSFSPIPSTRVYELEDYSCYRHFRHNWKFYDCKICEEKLSSDKSLIFFEHFMKNIFTWKRDKYVKYFEQDPSFFWTCKEFSRNFDWKIAFVKFKYSKVQWNDINFQLHWNWSITFLSIEFSLFYNIECLNNIYKTLSNIDKRKMISRKLH